MLVLGIETATPVGSVALVDDSKVIADYTLNVGISHSELLAPTIERVMSDAKRSPAELDGVAVSIGPGSFTGLRIGLSTAKGLCFANGCALIAVPTLDALAFRALFSRCQVCPMLDARKREVYAAFYDTSEGYAKRLSDPEATRPEDLLGRISESTIFIGEGAVVYYEKIFRALGEDAHFMPPDLNLPSAATVARLGGLKLEKGEVADPFEVEPIYLRKSEAELAGERR